MPNGRTSSSNDTAVPARDLAGMVHSRAWNPLLEILQRLDIVIELVDENLTPFLPTLGGRTASEMRRILVRLGNESLRAAIGRSMQYHKPELVTLGGVNIMCVPIAGARKGAVATTLLVAAERPEHLVGFGHESELERIGLWLSSAIEAHLSHSSSDSASDLQELSSLLRLLNEVGARGSEQEIIQAFVEALAVWQDVESWAYRGDLAGRFSLAVSLSGSDVTRVPAMFDGDEIPDHSSVVRLSPVEQRRLGFHAGGDLVVSSIRRQATTHWLIVSAGEIDARREARFALYCDVLGQSLSEVTAVGSSRLTWAMLQHLLNAEHSVHAAAQGAIAELSALVEAAAAFVVSRSDNVRVLTAGDVADVLTVPAPVQRPDLLIQSIDLPPPYTAAVGIRRPSDRPFTQREEKLLEAVGATLGAWLVAVLPQLATVGERRSGFRSFDQIVEQQTGEPVAREDISLIVVRLGEGVPPPDVARTCVGAIRSCLRPTDMAGRLTSGEVGVLLPDTPLDGAQVVVGRIREVLTSGAIPGAASNMTMGIACRTAGSSSTQSLLAQARAQAGTVVATVVTKSA